MGHEGGKEGDDFGFVKEAQAGKSLGDVADEESVASGGSRLEEGSEVGGSG